MLVPWTFAIALVLPTSNRPPRLIRGPYAARGLNMYLKAVDGDDFVSIASNFTPVDLGSTAPDATRLLEELEQNAASRLNSLGADMILPPPPPSPPSRTAFSKSTGTGALSAENEERLRRMREKESGGLETEHEPEISAARSMAKQWLDAGLPRRAEAELRKIAPYVSYCTEVGASVHLQLAAVLQQVADGVATTEVKRIRLRVMKDANLSSLRWEAERLLGSAAEGGGSANQELSNLFQAGLNNWRQ